MYLKLRKVEGWKSKSFSRKYNANKYVHNTSRLTKAKC